MKLRNLDRRLVTILLIVFVQMLGASMVVPILPLYASQEFGLSPQVITLLITSFFAAQFIAGPYIGRLSDRYGRVPVLIVSQIGTVIAFALIGAATSAWLLFFARILDGITGGNIIVAQAYVTDITPPEKRTESLGYIFAMFGIGFIFGPALGGVLAAAFGPQVPFYFAAVAAFAVVLLTWFTLDETVTAEQQTTNKQTRTSAISLGDISRSNLLLTTFAIAFVGQFAFGLLIGVFALFGEAVLFAGASPERVKLGVGLLLTVVGMTQFLTQSFVLRRLTAHFRDTTLVALGTLARAIGMIVLALATGPFLGAVSSVFFALGMGVMMPPLQSYVTKLVPDGARGAILGYFQSIVSLGTIASTAIAGVLFAIAPTLPFWLGALLSFLVLIPIFVLLRPQSPTQQQPAPAASD